MISGAWQVVAGEVDENAAVGGTGNGSPRRTEQREEVH